MMNLQLADIIDSLNNKNIVLEINKDLKKYSTMRLDAVGNLITVKNVEAPGARMGGEYFASFNCEHSLSSNRF
jgi:hypothetical protein